MADYHQLRGAGWVMKEYPNLSNLHPIFESILRAWRPPDAHTHICPKCKIGTMEFHVFVSSHFYTCRKCKWLEWRDPPWKDRS